jgi:RNA polymerase sigma-70 factor (ECF subfamily)
MAWQAITDDRDAFGRLFEAHREVVFRFLYRLARNRHDAEDLLQETFARLWRKRDQFRGEGSIEGYLRRIAYRTYLNARDRIARSRTALPLEVEPPDQKQNPAEQAGRRDLNDYLCGKIRGAVEELPDSWREPFVLYRYEGLRCREIAEVMNLTTKAVELRVAKALQKVAELLKELKSQYGESYRAG